MSKIYLSFLIAVLAGCSWVRVPSWIPFVDGKDQPIIILEEEAVEEVEINIDEGRMIQPERLQNGGNVLLVPFRAGPHVVASTELDQIAYRIMQGLSNQLEEKKPFFDVHISDKEVYPEFMVDGYFTVKKENSKFSKLLFRKNKFTVGVQGKLMDTVTREVIATFAHTIDTMDPDEDFNTLGFNLGTQIGDFITSTINIE